MLPRFHAPALTADLAELQLPDDEAHHLSKVLRLHEGDRVLVFDGAGLQRHAQVAQVSRSIVTVHLGRIDAAAPELSVHVTLAQAMLKGDSMDQVIRDATTIGVHEIVPLMTARTEARLPADRAAARVDRWRRVAVSAAKQCGRAVVPAVREPRPLARALEDAVSGTRVMLVEPLPDLRLTTLDELKSMQRSARVTIVVGPEGGWTSDELGIAARSGAALMSLGGRTLRAETVAIAGLPVTLHALGAWP
jgi:16S rRNA (uracil1498-N3)-methyltransferase